MARIIENFEVTVNGQTIHVCNDGVKSFEDQPQESMDALLEMIEKGLSEGLTTDWTPYANFESSVTWKLIK